jgi:hypothetical protein
MAVILKPDILDTGAGIWLLHGSDNRERNILGTVPVF